jgi:hypothetical protein
MDQIFKDNMRFLQICIHYDDNHKLEIYFLLYFRIKLQIYIKNDVFYEEARKEKFKGSPAELEGL